MTGQESWKTKDRRVKIEGDPIPGEEKRRAPVEGYAYSFFSPFSRISTSFLIVPTFSRNSWVMASD